VGVPAHGTQNVLKHSVDVRQHLVVPVAQHAVAIRFENFRAVLIGSRFRSVLAAIDLDNDPPRVTSKINDVTANAKERWTRGSSPRVTCEFVGRDRAISTRRHARPCAGHPRLFSRKASKSWMAGTSPAMTNCTDRTPTRPRALFPPEPTGAAAHVDNARAHCGGACGGPGLERRRPPPPPRLLRVRRALFREHHPRPVARAPVARPKQRTSRRRQSRPRSGPRSGARSQQ
jgi:hypothetical protein